MSTKDKQSLQLTPTADKETARTALRAIMEALTRMSGATMCMHEKTITEDIEPVGLFGALAAGAEDAFGVGADAVASLEQLIGVEVRMTADETGNPFEESYRRMKLYATSETTAPARALTS